MTFNIIFCAYLILWYSVPLSSIVQDCEQFISSIISLSPPRPLYSIVSPLFQSEVLFFKALAQVPVRIEHGYTSCKSFQLSNNKNRKSTFLEIFFLALIQILMQAVDRIWLLPGLMYLLDPPQDPPVSAH